MQHVALIEDSLVESILSRVPYHLKILRQSVEILIDEISEDYLLSAKKAIGIVFFLLLFCEGERGSLTQHLTPL